MRVSQISEVAGRAEVDTAQVILHQFLHHQKLIWIAAGFIVGQC